jgi:hypothetical protein
MFKKTFLIILLEIAIVLGMISCAGSPPVEGVQPAPPSAPVPVVETPPPASPPPPPPTDTAPDWAALDAAKADAELARKQVLAIEGDARFPADWESAEALYQTANDAPQGTGDEVQDAIARYQAATDAYNRIFQNGLSDYAQARAEELAQARQAALDAEIAPEYLARADGVASDAQEKYEAGDYFPASDAASQALLLYKALKAIADAHSEREQIVEHNFAPYDQERFDDADAAMSGALQAGGAGQDALTMAEAALAGYRQVLSTGWEAFATKRGLVASEEQQNALALKADVAVRDDYNAADALYREARATFNAGQFETAADAYGRAEASFANAARIAAEKWRAADAAIKAAAQKTSESDAIAQNAASILEGGAK